MSGTQENASGSFKKIIIITDGISLQSLSGIVTSQHNATIVKSCAYNEGSILHRCSVGWLVGCFGFNGPLRQYFSLYQAVSQREGERGEKG